MNYLYIVRHGSVAFADGIRRCIGQTDLPLSERGRAQALSLGAYFQARYPQPDDLTVFCSPLIRARETAQLLAGGRYPVRVEAGLQELYLGEWETVPMKEVKQKKTLESEPQGGESRRQGLVRIRKAITTVLSQTRVDAVCVTHAGIGCCLLADLLGVPLSSSRGLAQPYGGISRIAVSKTGEMAVEELGRMPRRAPDMEACEEIWDHYQTPGPVRDHCRAVCREAEQMTKRVNAGIRRDEYAGIRPGVSTAYLDLALVRAAALLHDVARKQPAHDKAGAEILEREGYPAVADIIRCHHDLGSVLGPVNEAKIVYLADKRIDGVKRTSMEARFLKSRKRCEASPDPEAALAAHQRRFLEARLVERQVRVYENKGQENFLALE